MPLYEYKCHSCDTKFEKMVSFSAVHLNPECPHCHSNETRKMISSFATGGSSPVGHYRLIRQLFINWPLYLRIAFGELRVSSDPLF